MTRTLIRRPAHPHRTDVKTGRRAWYDGEWIEPAANPRAEEAATGGSGVGELPYPPDPEDTDLKALTTD